MPAFTCWTESILYCLVELGVFQAKGEVKSTKWNKLTLLFQYCTCLNVCEQSIFSVQFSPIITKFTETWSSIVTSEYHHVPAVAKSRNNIWYTQKMCKHNATAVVILVLFQTWKQYYSSEIRTTVWHALPRLPAVVSKVIWVVTLHSLNLCHFMPVLYACAN